MTPERMRELAAEIVLDHARDIEFLSVCERLGDLEEDCEVEFDSDEDRHRIALAIHELARTATVDVSWPDEPPEPDSAGGP